MKEIIGKIEISQKMGRIYLGKDRKGYLTLYDTRFYDSLVKVTEIKNTELILPSSYHLDEIGYFVFKLKELFKEYSHYIFYEIPPYNKVTLIKRSELIEL